MPRTDTDEYALAAAFFEDVVSVRDFTRDSVRPIVERFAKEDHHDGTIVGLFLRSQGWLGTLAVLREPYHFQAALAGTRTLLEICVDLALLHHDRQNYTPAKVMAWERSAKLKAAERTRAAFENCPVPDEYAPRLEFIRREGGAIRGERQSFWPGRERPESHPERWTGRPLDADARTADAFGTYGLRDYYDTRFAELCWSTHGSGITGIRNVPEQEFPGLIAMAFREAARLGLLAAKLTLMYFDKFDPIMVVRFEGFEKQCAYWNVVGFARAKGISLEG